MNNLQSQTLQGLMRIVLETIEILMNTKNYKILRDRYKLLLEHIPTLAAFEKEEEYIEVYKLAFESYLRIYYDRTISETQIHAIANPSKLPLEQLYIKSINDCLNRVIEERKNEFKTLKQEKAKTKRIIDLLATFKFSIAEVKAFCPNAPQKDVVLKSFEEDLDKVLKEYGPFLHSISIDSVTY